MIRFSAREKAILAGLYLSKFDKKGLCHLGFDNFTEAFNVIGLALNVRPASIKNYRDEFDPVFPNNRLGWHKREMRAYVKEVYDRFYHLNLQDLSNLIKEIIYIKPEIDMLIENASKNHSFAKRLLTGLSAENYFEQNYRKIGAFKDGKIENTTKYGCGFDFKLDFYDSVFLAVEVKGLNECSGNILLTEKEYLVADILKERYFLFVVKNFKETPFHEIIQNPLNSDLIFEKHESFIKKFSWSCHV
jgi:hypothetical protein